MAEETILWNHYTQLKSHHSSQISYWKSLVVEWAVMMMHLRFGTNDCFNWYDSKCVYLFAWVDSLDWTQLRTYLLELQLK